MLPAKIACAAVLFAVMLLSAATAEVPNQISYQGRLTESDGSPVPDGDYNLTFQIVEHDPLPMGETPLWSSGVQAVTVTDGLFCYLLGSNVPLPASVFIAAGLESHFVRVHIEGSLTYGKGVQLVAVPFAYEAVSADTASYAHSGPGSGSVGWVDDGSVVRLQSGGDRVGIGTVSPGENLVVGGGDLGSYEGTYIVAANSEWDDYSGFKVGWNLDNHATINWHGDSDKLSFHTRSMGTSYNDNLVLRAGNAGIGVNYPTENLVVGRDLGSYSGNRIVVGDNSAGVYTGLVFGEDADNRAWLLWDTDANSVGIGMRDAGSLYGNVITLYRDRVGLGTTSPSERLVVGDDMGSFSGELIVIGNNGAGSYSGVKFGENSDNCGNVLWSNDNNYMYLITKENGTAQEPIYVRGGRLSIGDANPFAKFTVKGTGTCGHFENSGSFGGNVILAKSNNQSGRGIRAWATAEDGIGVLAEADGTNGIALHAEAGNLARTAILAEADVNFGVGIEARGGVSGKAAMFYGNVGVYSRVDDAMVMELGEGLDYAEGFNVTDAAQAAPGTVLSIDPQTPGLLRICNQAYDTKVAGIVAGANGLGSGVRLGANGFDHDVALAGRVYCNVDASANAVQPGDLLTTSALPGYAMKATDYSQAQGAILGKAMEALQQGERGQILVLVTLQ